MLAIALGKSALSISMVVYSLLLCRAIASNVFSSSGELIHALSEAVISFPFQFC